MSGAGRLRRIAVAGVGLVGVAAALGAATRVWLLGGVDERVRAFALAGAIALLAYAALDRERVGAQASRRAVRYAARATTLVAIAALTAAVLQAAAVRSDAVVDLTVARTHALAAGSVRVVEALEDDVQILGFFPHGSPVQRRVRPLVDQLVARSPHLDVTWVDPLREPLRAAEHGVTIEAGELVLARGDRRERLIGRFDEAALVDALVRIAADTEHTVCWSVGHGEADPDDDQDDDAASAAVLALEARNVVVERLRLETTPVPDRCALVVVHAPSTAWSPAAREALTAHVLAGGRALFLLEPGLVPDLASDLGRFGLRVGKDVVVDDDPARRPMGLDDPGFLVLGPREWSPHPITDGLPADLVLGFVGSVDVDPSVEGASPRVLITAGPTAWAETEPFGRVVHPDPHEARGDVPLAAVSTLDGGGRVVVVGDGSFATNAFFDVGGHRELFLDAVAWLLDETDQLGERADAVGDTLVISSRALSLLGLVGLVGVPGGLAIVGLWTRWARRRR